MNRLIFRLENIFDQITRSQIKTKNYQHLESINFNIRLLFWILASEF